VTIAVLARDLIIATRIADTAARAGVETLRVDEPDGLPPPSELRLVFVDWGARQPGWARDLVAWRDSAGGAAPRILLFGPHTDLAAHADARSAGLGPMLARSKLVAGLGELMASVRS
jgi:hypothetical protein